MWNWVKIDLQHAEGPWICTRFCGSSPTTPNNMLCCSSEHVYTTYICCTHTHTHTQSGLLSLQLTLLHTFNGRFPRTTWVNRHQKGKISLDLNEARDDGVLGWQWHQLDHMQTICTSLQTDNHANTSSLNFLHALPDAQPTVSKHWGHWLKLTQGLWTIVLKKKQVVF